MYTSGIYKITNIANNHIYIGSAKNLTFRWYFHCWQLKRQQHHSIYLQRAWNKYGQDAFIFTVLEYCSVETLLLREQVFLDDINPEYNICKIAGSCLGRVVSEKSKEKQRLAMTGRKQTPEHIKNASITRIGRKHTPEHIEKVRQGNIGKVRSEESKLKISVAKTGCVGPNLGRKLSIEWKKNIGLSHKGMSTTKKGQQQPSTQGAKNHQAKLTEEQAITLLTTDNILTYREATKKYGVTKACIKDIWQRRSWKYLNYAKVIKEDNFEERSGEAHPFGQLKEHEAIAILTTDKNLTVNECCTKYNVSRIVIEQLRSRKTWKQLEYPAIHTKALIKALVGSTNGNSKLNDATVRLIKQELEDGKSCCSIGKQFKVSNVTIANIRDNKSWKHVSI